MLDDPDYAYGWHCNIAMSCYDAIPKGDLSHAKKTKFCNDAASVFMKRCFNVVTEQQ